MEYMVKKADFYKSSGLSTYTANYVTFTLDNGREFKGIEFCISNDKLHFINHHMSCMPGKELDELPDTVTKQLYELYKKNN